MLNVMKKTFVMNVMLDSPSKKMTPVEKMIMKMIVLIPNGMMMNI